MSLLKPATQKKGLFSFSMMKKKAEEPEPSATPPSDEPAASPTEDPCSREESPEASPERSLERSGAASPEPSDEDEPPARTGNRLTYSIDFLKSLRNAPGCQELPESHQLPPGLLKGAKEPVTPGGKDDMRGSLFGKRLGQAPPSAAKGKGGEKGKRNEKGPRREEIAPLKNSEESWFMTQKKAKENDEDEDTKVIRAMNSIL